MSVEKEALPFKPLSGETEALIRELLQIEKLVGDLQVAYDLIKERLMLVEPRARDWLADRGLCDDLE